MRMVHPGLLVISAYARLRLRPHKRTCATQGNTETIFSSFFLIKT